MFSMIYALSLNPCLDKSLSLEQFDVHNPNRVTLHRRDVGGKGVNVARVIYTLGGDVTLMGFDFENAPVRLAMEREGVPHRLLQVKGDMRVNLKIREEATRRTIEINEKGVPLSESALKDMENMLLGACEKGDHVSLSGSLPNGAPKDLYARLTQKLRAKGCFVALDCDGEAQRLALEAGPSLIKPNLPEFLALTGTQDAALPELLRLCRTYHRQGIGMICLSMGGEGALLSTDGEAYFCPAADVPVRGTQGAGDSMLGALLCALHRGENLPEALLFASAAANASVMREGTLLCTMDDTMALLPRMQVSPITP